METMNEKMTKRIMKKAGKKATKALEKVERTVHPTHARFVFGITDITMSDGQEGLALRHACTTCKADLWVDGGKMAGLATQVECI